MAMPKFDHVQSYLQALPEPGRSVLAQVCRVIDAALPRAEAGISYNIPTWKIAGRMVIHCAAWKNHYALYPVSSALVAAIVGDDSGYELEKGTIRLRYDAPVPEDLIARIAIFRADAAMQEGK